MENNNDNQVWNKGGLKWDRHILRPRSEAEINWIASEMVEWAKQEESVTMLAFSGEYLIAQTTLYQWEKKYPCIREAMRISRALVGARREKLALENKFNSTIVGRTLGVYDETVRQYDREMKLLSNQGEEKAQTINVVVPNMPSSDKVPRRGRKKKEEDSQDD